jgi:hypothetical protein
MRKVGASGPDPQRRRAALAAARQRYGGLSAAGKRRLLDELQQFTWYHRKSLFRSLNRQEPPKPGSAHPSGPERHHHRRRYGPEVLEALLPLWETSDRLCGKRPLPAG